jgi:hypothetical protein
MASSYPRLLRCKKKKKSDNSVTFFFLLQQNKEKKAMAALLSSPSSLRYNKKKKKKEGEGAYLESSRAWVLRYLLLDSQLWQWRSTPNGNILALVMAIGGRRWEVLAMAIGGRRWEVGGGR